SARRPQFCRGGMRCDQGRRFAGSESPHDLWCRTRAHPYGRDFSRGGQTFRQESTTETPSTALNSNKTEAIALPQTGRTYSSPPSSPSLYTYLIFFLKIIRLALP